MVDDGIGYDVALSASVNFKIDVPRDLNKAIKCPNEICGTGRMPNAKRFSKLDASSGFWQVKFDHQAICTFNLGATCSSGYHSASPQPKMFSKPS